MIEGKKKWWWPFGTHVLNAMVDSWIVHSFARAGQNFWPCIKKI